MPRRYLRRNTASHIRSVNTGGAEFRRGPVDQSGRGIAGSCPTTEAKRQFLFPLPTCVVYPFLCPSAAACPTLRGREYGGRRMHQPKARSEAGRKVGFYMALGLVAAATPHPAAIALLRSAACLAASGTVDEFRRPAGYGIRTDQTLCRRRRHGKSKVHARL
jgi:hypothetical protein